ncbi:hypothetical protein Y032_0058g2907 [Ancylostoma ceylanicum]|uniref:Uncharacterized protein n=1 Tax=Ancylostoma ceylanicum TaxID=53326 RepID=A0A016U5T9_9BILA|nr:hypothetical protein Y032_0058g2907 [Ancylostoma ceylanicum]
MTGEVSCLRPSIVPLQCLRRLLCAGQHKTVAQTEQSYYATIWVRYRGQRCRVNSFSNRNEEKSHRHY